MAEKHSPATSDLLWDALLTGDPTVAGDETSSEGAVRYIANLYSTPTPGAARERARQRVFETDLSETENTMTAATIPISIPNWSPPRTNASPRRPMHRAWLSLTAAVLILLAGLGSWFAYERVVSNDGAPAAIPAVQPSPTGWPQFRGGAARTGYTGDPGPGGSLDLRWTFTADEVLSNVVSDDGAVYVSGRKGGLWALDAATGEQRWGVDLSQGEYSNENRWPIPTVADGVVYQGTYDGNVIALDAADGSVIWQKVVSTGPIVASVTFINDVLFVITSEGAIRALDAASGDAIWEWTSDTGLSTWAAAVGGGLLYIPDVAGDLVAIDTATGESAWIAELGDVYRNPAYSDGAVYIGSDSGSYYALDAADGALLWTSDPVTAGQTLNPVVTPTELIVSYENGPLLALDRATGAVIWSGEGPGNSRSAHASADAVYSVSRDLSSVVAYDLTTGEELGRVSASDLSGNAAISGDAIVFGGNGDPGVVRSFGPGTGEVTEVTAGPSTVIEPETAVVAPPSALDDLPSALDTSQLSVVWQTDPAMLNGVGPLAVAPNGEVYVVDLETDSVQIFGPDGTHAGSMGETGSGPGAFLFHQGDGALASIDIDADGNIYVFDTYNNRVQKFASDGNFLLEWGQSGSGNGDIQEATGGIDPKTGTVYVTDLNGRVQVFDSDGNFLDKFGSAGTGPGKFLKPLDVVVDSQGNIYISQEDAGPIQVFDPYGQYLRSVVPPSGSFSLVLSMALDANDNLYVAHYGGNVIQIFDPAGELIGEFSSLPDGSQLSGPVGIALDAEGNLYISDEGSHRVVKLTLP